VDLRFFADRLQDNGPSLAVVTEDGSEWTYAALAEAADAVAQALRGRPALVVIEMANQLACVLAYLGCLRRHFPVLLVEPGSIQRDTRVVDTYRPTYIFRQSYGGGWAFEAFDPQPAPVHPDLCVLLSTSGTTGSPKLVRLSRDNIGANAASIAEYLGILPSDRALTTLPLSYSYGMSVLNSHLHAGACLLLTAESVDSEHLWQRAERERASCLAGVPFTFDILERLGFRSRRYPALRYLTQAGGRMPAERVRLYADWAEAQGKQFFVMYGQTEASPRMSYVPPGLLRFNPDAIGQPIPGGSFDLCDSAGGPLADPDDTGELVYRGPNVMMGYAETDADLALGKLVHELRTGDLARRKSNGMYVIVGRKSRFSKLLGVRISLDELERWLERQGMHGAIAGDDQLLGVALSGRAIAQDVKHDLIKRFGLAEQSVEVMVLEQLPLLASGKTDYSAILRQAHQQAQRNKLAPPSSLLDGYAAIIGAEARPGDSFLDLGADSVCFVEVSLLVEDYLGYLPRNWEAMPIASLVALKEAKPAAARPAQRSFAGAAMVALALLVAGEGALQLRSYLKTGRSAAAVLTGHSTVMFNEAWQVPTYRPNNHILVGDGSIDFTTNSLGLRSPEIPREPAPGEFRMAVAGASTVAGAYAWHNNETFPSLLEARLRTQLRNPVNVINAGIEGHTLDQTVKLVENGLAGLRPSVIVIYPGLNNMRGMCQRPAPARVLQPLPAPGLPSWILTNELIVKNTRAWLLPEANTELVDPVKAFPQGYRHTLVQLVRSVRARGIQPVLMTVARAFHGLDRKAGYTLAETALYYNNCLDYDGLVKAGELFNQAIADVAKSENVPLLDLAATMPGGARYFKDAGHFTLAGRRYVADYLAQQLAERGLLKEMHLSED
jgi:acyl-CoA synthetase (AMP-forming)/AMP-acid ligase II/lysophospholipase L1-like esterase